MFHVNSSFEWKYFSVSIILLIKSLVGKLWGHRGDFNFGLIRLGQRRRADGGGQVEGSFKSSLRQCDAHRVQEGRYQAELDHELAY